MQSLDYRGGVRAGEPLCTGDKGAEATQGEAGEAGLEIPRVHRQEQPEAGGKSGSGGQWGPSSLDVATCFNRFAHPLHEGWGQDDLALCWL